MTSFLSNFVITRNPFSEPRTEPARPNNGAAVPPAHPVRQSQSPGRTRVSALDFTTSPKRSSQDAALPNPDRTPIKKHRISEEERRGSRLQREQAPMPLLRAKPSSGGAGFNPRNGIHDGICRDQSHRMPHKQTYGQNSYTPGQVGFRDRFREDKTGSGHTSKRRKIGLDSATTEVINLDDEDELARSPVPHRPHAAPHAQQSAATLSPRSLGSGNSLSSKSKSRAEAVPSSSFLAVERLTDPRRKRSRNGTTSVRRSSNGTSSHTCNVITVHEDEIPQNGARTAILENLKQGSVEVDSQNGHTSHHWPKAKINTSTSTNSSFKRRANGGNSLAAPNKFRHPPRAAEEISDDELQVDNLTARAPARSRNKIQNKPSYSCGTSKPAKPHDKIPSRGWHLNFFRTHGTEVREPELLLKSGGQPDTVRIVSRADDGVFRDVFQVGFKSITDALADDSSRIRIRGPRNTDGNQPLHDFEFKNPSEFKAFLHGFVLPHTINKKYLNKDESFMQRIFDKPLDTNTKVGMSPLADDDATSPPVAKSEQERRPEGQRPCQELSTLGRLKSSASSSSLQNQRLLANAGAANTNTDCQATITSSRPTRSTRSSHPTFIDIQDEEPYKYSLEKGLGAPWHKPLEYGSGRHRALVEHSDLERLDEGEFLNDSLLDFYMLYLFDQAKVPSNKVYFFNTHFFTTLTRTSPGQKSPINYNAVKRWTSKVDLFNYDYIVVPINEHMHWYLAIICNISNINREPMHYDLDQNSSPAPGTGIDPAANSSENSKSEKYTGPTEPSGTNHSSSAQGAKIPEQNDDVMLLDEEANLNLVGAEPTEMKETALGMDSEPGLQQSSSSSESTTMRQLTVHDASIPGGILPDTNTSSAAAKKKPKRRPAQSAKKRPLDEPVVLILDSLGINRAKAVRALKNYILEEGRDKRGMEAIIKANGYYAKDTQIPYQQNFSDCGVYLLGYLQKFFKDPDAFKVRLLSGEMTVQTDWPNMEMSLIRNTMRSILLNLGKERELQRKQARAQRKIAQQPSSNQSPATAVSGNPPNNDKQLRLGSPFQPQSQEVQKAQSSPPQGEWSLPSQKPQSESPVKVMKVDESPPGPQSSSTNANVKRNSPKVVVSPRLSPNAPRSSANVPHDPNQTNAEAIQQSPRPLKRPLIAKDEEQLRPSKKSKSPPPAQFSSPNTTEQSPRPAKRRQHPEDEEEWKPRKKPKELEISEHEANSPQNKNAYSVGNSLQAPPPTGSSSQPISIDDSQDTAAVTQPSSTQNKTSESCVSKRESPRSQNNRNSTFSSPFAASKRARSADISDDHSANDLITPLVAASAATQDRARPAHSMGPAIPPESQPTDIIEDSDWERFHNSTMDNDFKSPSPNTERSNSVIETQEGR